MSGQISTDVGTQATKNSRPFPPDSKFHSSDWDKLPVGSKLEVIAVDKAGNVVLRPVPEVEGVKDIHLPRRLFTTTNFHVITSAQQYPLFMPADLSRFQS